MRRGGGGGEMGGSGVDQSQVLKRRKLKEKIPGHCSLSQFTEDMVDDQRKKYEFNGKYPVSMKVCHWFVYAECVYCKEKQNQRKRKVF